MADLCKTYVGGQPVKGPDMIIGPILGLASAGSIHVDVVEGSGDPGEYGYQVSDTGGHFCELFTRGEEGLALFVMGAPILLHRMVVKRVPAPGTTVKVCLVV